MWTWVYSKASPEILQGVSADEVSWSDLREGVNVGWRECEDVLELLLLKMRSCGSAEECREVAQEVLALVKERKLESLKEELGLFR
ncbi:MAG: hypothetical protein QXO23_04600 [Candidatus Methanomethyliaceae archaeon]